MRVGAAWGAPGLVRPGSRGAEYSLSSSSGEVSVVFVPCPSVSGLACAVTQPETAGGMEPVAVAVATMRGQPAGLRIRTLFCFLILPVCAATRSTEGFVPGRERASSSARLLERGPKNAALYLYAAVSRRCFPTKGHFFLASSLKNPRNVLLVLGLAPKVSEGQCRKIQVIVKALFEARFFLNNTQSIDEVLKALPDDSVKQFCTAALSRSISYLSQESNNKEAVGGIFAAAGITTRWYVEATGRGVGKWRCAVYGISPMSKVAPWNYGVKLYKSLIGDNAENSGTATAATAGAKRKPDAPHTRKYSKKY